MTDQPRSRPCIRCLTPKPLTFTHWYAQVGCIDGFGPICKACKMEEQRRKRVAASTVTPTKACISCLKVYPLTEANFYRSRKNSSGWQGRCKSCEKTRDKAIRSGHSDPEHSALIAERAGSKHVAACCAVCANLPHRVEGVSCVRCGLRWQAEPKPELELRRHYDMRAHL